jgi:Uma2 family endonuclease
LCQARGDGEVITECSVETDKGVKVADVAWCSDAFLARHGLETPFTDAPELCAEVISPSNSEREMDEKRTLYFSRGATEVSLASEEGQIRTFGPEGERQSSVLVSDQSIDESGT